MNPVLARLDVLVGEWRMRASVDGQQTGSGRTVFEWLPGQPFLVQRAEADPPLPSTPEEWVANSPFPVTTLTGLDDSAERFSMLYADARDVQRVYQMTMADGVWTIWRDAPGFYQRFTGRLSPDGRTITARWEGSRDGSTWQPDFDVTYTKLG